MDGGSLVALAQRFLVQDQDLAFSFTGATGNFVVVGFTANETVNAPFEIHVELASDDADIDLHALMDSDACLGIFDKYSQPRFLHGIVTEIEKGQSGIRRTFYSVVLRPSIHRLAHTSDSRIWQEKTIPELVREVLEENGIANIDWRLDASYEPREYATQYRETALDFIMRVLAEEGIFYFFEHTESSHTLVITDAPLATPVLEHAPSITCNTNTGGQSRGSWISQFSQRERLRSSAYEMGEYTFKNPAARMTTQRSQQKNNGLRGDYPLYDFPGRYKDPSKVGNSFVKHRIESVRVDATTGHGTTNNVHLSAGYHFTMTDHEDANANASHFLLSVSHSGQQSAALEEDAGSEPTTYQASFTTMPARLPYRPPLARKPIVDGPQIAMVTGPEGEEIYTDEYARIKCHFYWDRRSNKDEHSSCWIRVSQNWAGGTWGHMAIPRIGQSVIVDFLEGDPDQPIVTGRTYHATERPPYKLPEHKTRMTIKSNTHKGKGFNELRFEDEAGKEEVFVHAQRDRNEKTLNNHSERIDNSWAQSIGHNKAIHVADNHDEHVGGSMVIAVGSGMSSGLISKIAGKAKEGISQVAKAISAPIINTVGRGIYSLYVEKGIVENCLGFRQQFTGVSHHSYAGSSYEIGAGHNVGLHSGQNIALSAEAMLSIQSNGDMNIDAGASSIHLGVDGRVVISGKNLHFDFTEHIEMNADSEVTINTDKTEVTSDTTFSVQSGKISLN